MNLIKVSTKFYPYTIAELQSDYPNVSFPLGLEGVDLGDFDAAEVVTDDPPEYDDTKEAIEPLPPKKMKGVWRVRWEKRKSTKAEIKARTPANWQGFSDALLADEEFNCCYGIASVQMPAMANALIAELSKSPITVESFAPRFTKFCQVAEINEAPRHDWADLAKSFNLPDDFVEVLIG